MCHKPKFSFLTFWLRPCTVRSHLAELRRSRKRYFHLGRKSARPADNYNRNLKAVHWLTLLLIAAAYAAICAIDAVAGGDQSAPLVELDLSC